MNLTFKAEHRLDDAWVYMLEIDSSIHVCRLHSLRRIKVDVCDTQTTARRGHQLTTVQLTLLPAIAAQRTRSASRHREMWPRF
jgi:hypothetical protein